MSSAALELHRGYEVTEQDFMPVLSVQRAVERKQMMNEFIGKVLIPDVDYGEQPGGAKDKKVLKKSGAEKLCSIFGLAPRIINEEKTEDWSGAEHGGEPFFYYKYTIGLYRGDRFMGEAVGSCNSWESKYRYRWVSEDIAKTRADFERFPKRGGQRTMFEPQFAIDKKETTGKYGKPTEYWQTWQAAIDGGTAKPGKKKMGTREFNGYYMSVDETQYRIANPDIADLVNTVQKMAHKRALVAPVLIVTNCSDAFTQDSEDFGEEPRGHFAPPEPPPGPPLPASEPLSEAPLRPMLLDDVLATFGKRANIQSAFAQLKAHFLKVLEPDAWEHLMAQYNGGDFKTVGDARKCFTAAWKMVEVNTPPSSDVVPEMPEDMR